MKAQIQKMLQSRLTRLKQGMQSLEKEFQMEPKAALKQEMEHHLMLAKEEGNKPEIEEFKLAVSMVDSLK
jgi:hypothetical protein